VLTVPQRWINGYPHDLANKIRDWNETFSHAAFEPGDFIVSFSGVLAGAGWVV
jgi:hypothetical protein